MIGKRFVAYADILGFKSLLREDSLEAVVAKVRALLAGVSEVNVPWLQVRKAGENFDGEWTKSEGAWRPTFFHFSDALILWSDILVDFNDLFRFTAGHMFGHAVAQLVTRAFVSRIPLRVGIAFGDMFIDAANGIIVGEPLVHAYELEQAQEWVGGAFHSSVPREHVHSSGSAVEYAVPLKVGGEVFSLSLDWCAPAAIAPEELRTHNQQLAEEAFDWYLATYPAAAVQQKYANARTFYRWRVAQGEKAHPQSRSPN